MSSKILNTITNPALVSRQDQLGVETSFTVDGSVLAAGIRILRGTLMGLLANTKYRPYFESVVTVAFSTASAAFTLDPTSPRAAYLVVGDVLEGTDTTALGTVLTYNPLTGAGTLAANSSNNFAADGTKSVRIPLATLALVYPDGKLLKDELDMDGTDQVGVGFYEGFFVKSLTTLTAAAITAMGAAYTVGTDEVRLK